MSSVSSGLYCRSALLPTGWQANIRLLIKDGHIASVRQEAAPQPGDEQIAIALPGMANLHSHAFQRGMAGLAERRGPSHDSFWTWRDMMYRFVGRIGPDDLEAIAAQAYAEMVECGFTRVAEFHYLHHRADGGAYDDIAEMSGRIAAAAMQSGIGLTLLPVFYAQGGFGGVPPGAAQARFINDTESYGRLLQACRPILARLPGAVLGMAPHSLRAVGAEQLRHLLTLMREGPVHIHIAEQQREVEDCRAFSGQRPVQHLFDQVAVDRRWCLVHATHINQQEMALLAASGAVAGLCPITEANLGDGMFPLPDYLAAGGRLGIGSDSNVLISLSEELRLLEYGQRLSRQSRNVAAGGEGQSTGRCLFDAALRGGAQACGVVSGLQEGAPADIVALDEEHPAHLSRQEDVLLDSFIFAQGGVKSVWRGGEKLVSDGVHIRRRPIRAAYRAALARLMN